MAAPSALPSARLGRQAPDRRERLFIDEYLVDMKGTQAAIRAGYKPSSARVIASQLLTKLNIHAALEVGFEERQRRTQITADKALLELARLAFSDVGALFDEHGRLKSVKTESLSMRRRASRPCVTDARIILGQSVPTRRRRRFRSESRPRGEQDFGTGAGVESAGLFQGRRLNAVRL